METNTTETPITANQVPQQNKYVEFAKRNKYIIFAFTMLAILLAVFSSIVFVTTKTPQQEPELVVPTKQAERVTPVPIPTSTLPVVPVVTISQEEQVLIETQVKPQLDKDIKISYTISKMKGYGEEWALIKIVNPNTDPANVVVKKQNGSWYVKLGPGTYFDRLQLQSVGAPQSLISEVNGKF